MTIAFKIQDGWPLPAVNRARRAARGKYPLDAMLVGQMFFIPERSGKTVAAYISRIARKSPGKFETRHVWAFQDHRAGLWCECLPGAAGAVEGTGVWRVE